MKNQEIQKQLAAIEESIKITCEGFGKQGLDDAKMNALNIYLKSMNEVKAQLEAQLQ